MTTHDIDIELPPLPKGDIAADTCPVMWVHTDQQTENYAREAIEADRKRRGEPLVLATYHAIVDESEKHIMHNTRTKQLEIYDEREDAVKAAPDHLSVMPVYVTATEGPLFAAPQLAEPDVLPGEAIFGFAAWLTSLKTPVTFSECHGAAIGADLAVAYNKSQGFDEIREDFHKRLKPYPEQEPTQPAEPVKD